MRFRGDAIGSPIIPSDQEEEIEDLDDGYATAAGGLVPAIEGERIRLKNERSACEASLQKLNFDLANLEAERELLKDAVQADPLARLRLVASMGDDLRTSLHAVLGYAQLFRMRGGLDLTQTAWVNAMLAAGTQLLGKVHCVVGLADVGTDPSAWVIVHEPPPADQEANATGAYSADVDAGGTDVSHSPAQLVLHVLVADDVEMSREIASKFIQAAGHTVVVAKSGAEAVAAAGLTDFDVILMDVRMPDMDGIEATRRIRDIVGARGRVPIIALTAQALSCKVDACRAAGMNGHLAKPYRYDTLNEAILAAFAEAAAKRGAETAGCSAATHSAGGTARNLRPGNLPVRKGSISNPALPSGGISAWIDIRSPWNSSAAAGRSSHPGAGGSYILDTQFKIKLTAIGFSRERHLVVGSTRTCAPPRDQNPHEFHWLLYTDPAPMKVGVYTATCDLWRWSGSTWQSISVAGAHFSPDEIYDQGWRYCGPCVEKTAMVEVA